MNGLPTSGKQRASRIPLDYYKHGDDMTRRKGFWTRLVLGLTVVWCLLLIPALILPAAKSTPVGLQRFSHGPVCRAHASIGHECSACHVDFPMLGGRDALADVLPGARSTFVGDKKCLECHLGAERNGKFDGYLAVHHANMKVEMTPNCGTCHEDHKGLDKDLRRVADADCTKCHKDVNASLTGGKSAFGNVSSFHRDHPAFRSVQGEDPSKIKFNHAYHMTKGIVLTPGGKEFKVENMADGVQRGALLERGLKMTDAVSLDCADCHRGDRRFNDRAWKGDTPVANLDKKDDIRKAFAERRESRPRVDDVLAPPRTPGAYMAPISYENHCAACHPLTFSPGLPPVKHSLQPKELREQVEHIIASSPEQAPKPPATFFPLPGKSPAGGKTNLSAQVDMAMRSLMEGKRTCGECHLDARGGDLSVGTQEIAKPNIPEVWLKHARFDHGQHSEARGFSCKDCHAQAYGGDPKMLLDAYTLPRKGAEVVMIPNIDNCRKCHSPTPDAAFAAKGLASKYDCTECHSYHQGTPNKK